MKSLLSCPILEINPNSIEIIRKDYNLDGPGKMEEAVTILRDWIQKQAHFRKKDFSSNYLEKCIITCKGSVERAKKQIDAMCTIKTLTPEFFNKINIRDIQDSKIVIANLPKTTDDFYRISVIKLYKSNYNLEEFLYIIRYSFSVAEYMKVVDYMRGFLVIFDVTGMNILELVKTAYIFKLKHALEVLYRGYGMRLKGLHFITDSTMVDVLISFMKQIVNSKVASRVHIHKTYDELYKFIPPRLLPKDYGGEEKSLKELMRKYIDVLSSEECIAFLEEMRNAGTDESCRLEKDQFNKQYAGVAGTFKALTVD